MTYRPVKITTRQTGCGTSFKEVRWFIERVSDGKFVKDVGPACYADVAVAAQKLSDRMNAR